MLMEMMKGRSLVFWAAERRGTYLWSRRGRAGEQGRMTTTELDSEAEAEAAYQAELAARLEEGFVVVDETASISAPFRSRAGGGLEVAASQLRVTYPHLFDRTYAMVRGGFIDREEIDDEIHEMLCVEFRRAFPPLEKKLGIYAAEQFAEWQREARTWTTTVNDQIEAAFAELNATGIVAMENAGGTQSDGWLPINDAATERARKGNRPRGGVFYHFQDLERAVKGLGLMLTFGAFEEDSARHAAATLAVGQDIVRVLEKHGVEVRWDGTDAKRIEIPPFPWRKRPTR